MIGNGEAVGLFLNLVGEAINRRIFCHANLFFIEVNAPGLVKVVFDEARYGNV